MADTTVAHEARMMIDGALVEGRAGTFANISPATEQVLGEVADASKDNAMTIAQEEIFGPVLAVIGFDDEDHAVRIANDSPCGLAGNVMSGSVDRALAVARRIRSGFLGVSGTVGYGADVPFGGYKASGVGRQNGVAGFDQYTEVKSVAYPASE